VNILFPAVQLDTGKRDRDKEKSVDNTVKSAGQKARNDGGDVFTTLWSPLTPNMILKMVRPARSTARVTATIFKTVK
jgi:hypothetical protein